MCDEEASEPLANAIIVPSGDHVGLVVRLPRPPVSPSRSTTCLSPVPSALITSTEPLSALTKAIFVPSGDQLGWAASSGPSRLSPAPSAFITYSRRGEGGPEVPWTYPHKG